MEWIPFTLGWAATIIPLGLAHRRKTRRENLLKHGVRQRIFDAVERNPGIRLVDFCRRLGVSRGSAQYHLYLLDRAGLLQGFATGKARRFCTPEQPFDEVLRASLLSRRPVRSVAQRILDQPGIIQKDLAESTGLSPKSVRSYVRLLRHDGLLVERPDSRVRRYHPTKLLRRAFSHGRESEAPSAGWLETPEDKDTDSPERKPRRPKRPQETSGPC